MVVGLSTDSLEEARQTVEGYDLTFPVAYGLDAQEFSALTGAFFNAESGQLRMTGFVVAPDGRVVVAVYSTGPIGKLTPAECRDMVDYASQRLDQVTPQVVVEDACVGSVCSVG